MKSLSHAEVVHRAVRWLRGQNKCSTVYAEMTTSHSEVPDVIGWHNGISHAVECKVSRKDFQKELRTKAAAIHNWCGVGRYRWYLTPKDLILPHEVPDWCGLAYICGGVVRIEKEAPCRSECDLQGEVQMLLSAIKRLEGGFSFDRKTARWESYRKNRKRT